MHRIPDLSILLMTYKDGRELIRTLNHFYRCPQDAKVQLEFLIVDVQSTLADDEMERIRQFSSALNIRLLSSANNNLALNRNLLIREAQAPLVLFLDADAELAVNSLNALWDEWHLLAAQTPNIIGLGGVNLPPENEGSFYDLQRCFQSFLFGHIRSPQMWNPDRVVRVQYLSTVFALFLKSEIEQAGGFRSSFSEVCEDQELGLRLSIAGKILLLTPNSQVIHRSEATWKGWLRRVFRFGKGQSPLMMKHPRLLFGAKGLVLISPLLYAGAAMLFEFFANPFTFVALIGFYLAWMIFSSLQAFVRGQISVRTALSLPAFSVLNHGVYAVAFYFGLFQAIHHRFRKIGHFSDQIITEMS